jgi:hypothetical protein
LYGETEMSKIFSILTAMVVISLALIGMAGADPFTLHGTNYYFKSGYGMIGQGSSVFDFSGSTGAFKLPSGVFTMTNGASIPAGKSLVMASGAGGITIGTGGITPTSGNIIMNTGVTISNSSPSAFNGVSTFNAPVEIAGTAKFNVTGGETRLGGNVLVGPAATATLKVSGATTVQSFTSNTTSTFTQQATMAQALKVTPRALNADYNCTSAGTKDGAFLMTTSGANKTIILQTPTAMGAGAIITIKAIDGPGSNYMKVTTLTNSSNTISGAKMYVSTDDVHYPSLTLMSTGGSAYYIIGSYGNWTATTK